MIEELLVAEALSTAEVQSIVGDRIAVGHLPADTLLPAVVHQFVSLHESRRVADYPPLLLGRLQVTALAANIGALNGLLAAIHAAIAHKKYIGSSGVILYARPDERSSPEIDGETEIWSVRQDFLLSMRTSKKGGR